MKKQFLFIIVFAFANSLFAQVKDFKSFQEQQRNKFRGFVSEQQQEFDAYRRKQNQQYVDFMREKWELFNSMPALKPKEEPPVPPVIYEEPKPEPAPTPAPAQKHFHGAYPHPTAICPHRCRPWYCPCSQAGNLRTQNCRYWEPLA